MKITDLSGLWFDTKDLSIISLPFISYSITRESFASKGMKGEIFRISYKSPILVPFSGSLSHPTMEIAKRKVHEHLEGLIQHFLKPLENVLIIGGHWEKVNLTHFALEVTCPLGIL